MAEQMNDAQKGQTYFIDENSLTQIATEIRRISNIDLKLTPAEMAHYLSKISPADTIYDAHDTAFDSTKIDPDIRYSINYNWFAQLVDLIQEMTGVYYAMYPRQILDNVANIAYIPQRIGSGEPLTMLLEMHIDSISSSYNPVPPEYVKAPWDSTNGQLINQMFITSESTSEIIQEGVK